MGERLKTILLIGLIISSLTFTSVLLYGFPQFNISKTEYFQSYSVGEILDLNYFLRPKEIIIHTKEGHHLTYPATKQGELLLKSMNNWRFHLFTKAEKEFDWRNLIEDKSGIELKFNYPINQSANLWFQSIDNLNKNEKLNILWLYLEEDSTEKSVKGILFTEGKSYYYTIETNISPQEFLDILAVGTSLPNYNYYLVDTGKNLNPSTYYVPKENFAVKSMRYFYRDISVDKFIEWLFINPNLVQKINDPSDIRRKVRIYTDGSRGIYYYPQESALEYYQFNMINNKKITYSSNNNWEETLNNGIRFVNQYGGWNGGYYLKNITNLTNGNIQISFQPHINNYPIITNENQTALEIELQENNVRRLKRSTYFLDKEVEWWITNIGGDQTIEKILNEKNISRTEIVNIEIVYRSIKSYYYIDFQPGWQIELSDGSKYYIFSNKLIKEDANGLE